MRYFNNPISPNELESMHSMINYYLENGSNREKRLAKNLLKAVTWIEKEMKINNEMLAAVIEGFNKEAI